MGEKYQCSLCDTNPNNKKVWGCEKNGIMHEPTMAFDDNGVHTHYWACPLKFVPDSIWRFMTVMDYQKTFPGAHFPSMDRVSLRFLLAHRYFDQKLIEYQVQAAKRN